MFWLGIDLILLDPINLFTSTPKPWWQLAGIPLLTVGILAIRPFPEELLERRLGGLEKALNKSLADVQRSMRHFNDSTDILQDLQLQVEAQRMAALETQRDAQELYEILTLRKRQAEAITNQWDRRSRAGEQRALVRDALFFGLGVVISVLSSIAFR